MMKFNVVLCVTLLLFVVIGKAQTSIPTPTQAVLIKHGDDDLYQSRLASLKTSVELIYRTETKRYIDAYLDNPEKTRHIIAQSKIYFPLIERTLRNKNIPVDLKYMAVALSELEPAAQNQYGATGLWMMMYNVSKMYKAKVNSFVDERRDPYKASVVAATHFKDLYSIYHQWPLVIAAYASSPVMLNKCIRMANNSLYFWDVYPYLPESTRDVYPQYIAAVYIMNFYREHGIKPVIAEPPAAKDSVLVNKWLSFQQISATLDIPLSVLRGLNPVFKKDIIPYNIDGYKIYLPSGKAGAFEQLKDSIYSPLPKSGEFVPVAIQKESTDSASVETKKSVESKPKSEQVQTKSTGKQRIYYTIKRGDVLGDIAIWFDATPQQIRSWNKLKSSKIIAGQKLAIWVPESKTGYYKRINTMSAAEKNKLKHKR